MHSEIDQERDEKAKCSLGLTDEQDASFTAYCRHYDQLIK